MICKEPVDYICMRFGCLKYTGIISSNVISSFVPLTIFKRQKVILIHKSSKEVHPMPCISTVVCICIAINMTQRILLCFLSLEVVLTLGQISRFAVSSCLTVLSQCLSSIYSDRTIVNKMALVQAQLKWIIIKVHRCTLFKLFTLVYMCTCGMLSEQQWLLDRTNAWYHSTF